MDYQEKKIERAAIMERKIKFRNQGILRRKAERSD